MLEKLNSIFYSLLSLFRLLIEKKKLMDERIMVFVSHSANESGGAPVVLYELASVLSKTNKIVFLSKRPGTLIDKCRDNGIFSYTYGYFPNLFFLIVNKNAAKTAYIVNTIVCGKCISILQKNKNLKIYWWLHENEEIYKIMRKQLPLKIMSNVIVKCVSESAKSVFNKYYPNTECSLMYYGLPDSWDDQCLRPDRGSKWRLLSIGQIVERKNQLRLLDAWKEFCQNSDAELELVIVGKGNGDEYEKTFIREVNSASNVQHYEYVPRCDVKKLYLEADAYICVSVSDPMPVVVTEAFMYRIPCILSNTVGQCKYVDDGVNAVVCDPSSVSSIVEAMNRAYTDQGNSIGNNGRRIYEKYFSIDKIAETITI